MDRPSHTLTVLDDGGAHEIDVSDRTPLRTALIANDLSPHGPLSQRLNCGGRGHCALCAVRLGNGAPEPAQWLDALAARFGYRISCQVEVDDDLTVHL